MKAMHSRGIGTDSALLYSTWTDNLMKNNLFYEAETVFKMGLNRNVQVKNDLQNQYE